MTNTTERYVVSLGEAPLFDNRADAETYATAAAKADPGRPVRVAAVVATITAEISLTRASHDGKDPDGTTPPNFFGM